MTKRIDLYKAMELMRNLTASNIPFSIEFVGCNLTKQQSSGVKKATNVILRTGLSGETDGQKSNSLIGYVDLTDNSNKWFYLPLLISVNDLEVL